MKNAYNKTITACFLAYIVQAIINNFVPLLFLTFQSDYGIPLSQITLLVTLNFGIQLAVDLLSVGFVDRIGYRASMVLAHLLSGVGLLLLTVLPELLGFGGILFSVMVYAIGGGLLEVLVSPVVEACPSEHKEKAMSMLHSFYCWGHVGVVLLSTAFFYVFGVENWKILALVWAALPLLNGLTFTRVPMASLIKEGEQGLKIRQLFSMKTLCILAYLGISLFPVPQLSLVACAVCGLSVGILWPGTFSSASAMLPAGGTAMFALLALGGDAGCTLGPTLVGMVSGIAGDNLKLGILAAVAFPLILLACLAIFGKQRRKNGRNVHI